MSDQAKIKLRLTRDRYLAVLALVGALICTHYTYGTSGWQTWAFAVAFGFLASLTVTRTLKASIWASTLVATELIKEIAKESAR